MKELIFSSEDEALQHLSDVTGKKIKVANEKLESHSFLHVVSDKDKDKIYVETSVHDDPRLGGQILKDDFKYIQNAIGFAKRYSNRWGVKFFVWEQVGQWPNVEYKKIIGPWHNLKYKKAKVANKSSNLKMDLENAVKKLISKYEMNYDGEQLVGDISNLKHWVDGKTVRVSFGDENMAVFLSGGISSQIFDEFENIINNLGYEIVDTDGEVLWLEKI